METLARRIPFLMVVIRDFNAKSKHQCSQDRTNFEGITFENVTSKFGLSQIIKEATHILDQSLLPRPLFLFSQRSLHRWLNLVCTHLCIQIITIKLGLQNLIYKYITHNHTHKKSGTISRQILNLSDGQLLTLTGIEPFSILIFTKKFLSSAALY